MKRNRQVSSKYISREVDLDLSDCFVGKHFVVFRYYHMIDGSTP
jgi:hypothetical protein